MHRRCRLLELLKGHFQVVEQGQQRPGEGSFQPRHFVVGFDTVELRRSPSGVAQQHAPHAEAPGVLLEARRHAQAFALLGIKSPAHTGTVYPTLQSGYVGFINRKTCAQGRYIQQVDNVAGSETAMGQFEQVLQGDQQRLAAALALVGHGKRQVARVVPWHLAEHCLDVRGVGVDVRHHHDHIPRA